MSLFISHVTNADGATASRLVAYLEQHGQKCWIAPRDIKAGASYAAAIADAIEACDAMVLLLSPGVAQSDAVARELELCVGRHKKPAHVLRLKAIGPPKNVAYYIAANQWIDAFDRPLEDAADALLAALGHGAPMQTAMRRVAGHAQRAGLAARRLLIAASVAAIAAGLIGATAWLNRDEVAEVWRRYAERPAPVETAASASMDDPVPAAPPIEAPVEAAAPPETAAEIEAEGGVQSSPVDVAVRGPRQRGDLMRGARILRVTGADAEGAEGPLETPPRAWSVSASGVVDIEIALPGDAPVTLSRVEVGFGSPWDGQILVAAAPSLRDGPASYGFTTTCSRMADIAVCLLSPQRVRALRLRLVPPLAGERLHLSSIAAHSDR